MIRRLVQIAASLCTVLAATQAQAQAPVVALDAPRLVISTPTEAPVSLRAVRVQTQINGRSALTEVTLTFFNPNPRQLEGELQFPLQEGQAVVGMAMDVGGTLREAVPVDKARGEAVFEDVTRARIDPALLSKTQGDNYKLRVYPIEPRSEKVVVLRYAEWLAPRAGGSVYLLPMAHAARLASFTASVNVTGVAGAPLARVTGATGLDSPAFAPAGAGWRLDIERRDLVARGVLEVALVPAAGGSVSTQMRDGRSFFVAPLPVAVSRAPRPLPRTVSLVWDASGSGATRDHGREFALLGAYFARARNVEVRLVRVRDAAEPVQRFTVTAGDWHALRAALESTVYDGATDLGAVVPERDAGEVLLFSDGLSNFGSQRFAKSAVPVYAVSAAARADSGRLRASAEASGGRFIDLTRAGAEAAAALLLNAATRVVAIESDGATQLVAASIHPADGGLTLAGELTQPRTLLRVVVEHPGGRRQTIAVEIDAQRDAGVIAAQGWARLKIAALDAEYALNRAEIRRLGAAFGIVSRETSLIILDRAEDYARHEIAPPPELAAEVARLRSQMVLIADRSLESQLDRVARLFQQKQAWWQRDFPKDAPPRRELAKSVIADGMVAPSMPSSLAASPPPAPPSPSPIAAPTGALKERARAAAEPGADKRAKDAVGMSADATPATTIRLRPAASDAPYTARLRAAADADLYRIYLDERASYTNSTAFVLDVADVLFERGQPALGLRVLSNLAEMDLENRQVLRILGQRLVQAGRPDLAVPVLRTVLALAPDEPQSQRDLGLALAAAGQPQAAIDALYEVVRRPWPRFPEIELIALAELNAIVATRATADGQPLDTARIDPRLLKNLPLALRATLAWDADNTDIDLWVTDPNGERAFYGNALTYQGGRMSKDITSGYGPEEFSLRRAKPGKYLVQANFYGHRQQLVAGATTIQLVLETGFGTAAQKEQRVTLRLKGRNDHVFVGEFEVAAAGP